MRSSSALRDSLSLVTTHPVEACDPDLMSTLIDSQIRWKMVHEQARLIAARNAARKRVEAECAQAEKSARKALNILTTTVRERRKRVLPWLVTGAVVALAWMLVWHLVA